MTTRGETKNKVSANIITILAVLLTALVLIGVFVFVYSKYLRQAAPATGQMMVDTRAGNHETENPLEGRHVSFIGINDATISEGDTIALENAQENLDFLMKFQIMDTDSNTAVYETDLIPSGQSVIWTPSEDLDKGVHHLEFVQMPFWQDSNGEYIPLTAGNNQVELTIM